MSSGSPAWEYAGSGFLLGSEGLSSADLSDLLSEKSHADQRIVGERETSAALAREMRKSREGRVRDRSQTHPVVEGILKDTSDLFGFSRELLTGNARRGSLPEARAYAARRLTDEAGLNYSETGKLLGMTRQGVLYLLTGKERQNK
jgi:hypothetical protein